MTLDELHEGMSVLYIPPHAHRDRTHPDCQRGMVTSMNATQVFVQYGTDRYSHATLPVFLVSDDHTAHIPHPSDGDPPIFPGAFSPRTAHPNSGMLSSHERRDTKRLCFRSVVWGSFYRPSKCTRSNICPL